MAAVAIVGSSRQRVSWSTSARRLLLATLVTTVILLTAALLVVPMTPTVWNGNSPCAAEVGDRKLRRPRSEDDDPVNATAVSSASGHRRFIVNNVHLCDAVADDDEMTSFPEFVVVVHSRPGQRGRMQRDAIRATWGSPLHRRVMTPDIRLAFVLGRERKCGRDGVASSSCSEAVRRESRLYQDVVVADFVDAYRSLSLKSLSALLWARRHCSAARYVVKVDDDVYLRPDLLPRVRQLTSNASDSLIVGSINVNSTVQRRGLWRVDVRAFPSPTFPPYCSGNVYAMTASVADRLLAVAAENEGGSAAAPFPLEDVHVTALLATPAGARCVHDDVFPRWDVGPTRANVDRLRNGNLLAVHNVHYTQMYDILQRLNDHAR